MDLSKVPSWLLAFGVFGIAVAALYVFVLPGRGIEWNAAYYGPYRYNSDVIAGQWDGNKLTYANNGSKLKVKAMGGGLIRLEYEDYNFQGQPIVLVSGNRLTKTSVETVTNQYVDIREKAFNDKGTIEGPDVTDRPFSFQIIPSVKQ